jgi:hypothetical protein
MADYSLGYLIGASSFTFAAGIGVAYLAHRWARDRDIVARSAILDREADVRRREFRKFILKTGFTFERTKGSDADKVWALYESVAPDILAEAALVEGDVRDPKALMAAVRCAGEWKRFNAQAAATQQKCEVRSILRESIRAIEPHIKK